MRCQWLRMMFCTALVMSEVPAAWSQEKAEAQGDKPLLTMYGRNSKITKPRFLRITSADDWRALWLEHKTGSAKPDDLPGDLEYAELDFEKVMAIALFQGEGCNCRGFTSHAIKEDEGQVLVRLKTHWYQSGPETPDTQAWGILVLPRSTKEVILEHNVASTIGAPPVWEQWKRFPELPAKKR